MTPMKIAIIVGKMDSGGKKNLIMEYYRHIDRDKIQFDFICDSDSQAIPEQEILELGGNVYKISPYQHIVRNMADMAHHNVVITGIRFLPDHIINLFFTEYPADILCQQ